MPSTQNGPMPTVDRNDIIKDLIYIRKNNTDEKEYLETMADFCEELIENASINAVEGPGGVQEESVDPIALGIHIHKTMVKYENTMLSSDQLAYRIAKELNFHYTLYYKHGKKT